jgi:hypothetical protein
VPKKRSKSLKIHYVRGNYRTFFSLSAFSQAKLAQEKADNELNEKWKIVQSDPSVTQEQRELFVTLSQVAGICSRLLKQAEEYQRSNIIEDRTYKLYKDPKSKRVVIICHYYKLVEKRFKYRSIILNNGLPTNSRPKTKTFWTFQAIPPKGMKLVAKGTFRQKHVFFDKWIYYFYGNKKFSLYNYANSPDKLANWTLALTKEKFNSLKDKRSPVLQSTHEA